MCRLAPTAALFYCCATWAATDALDPELLQKVKAATVFIRAGTAQGELQGSGFFCDGNLVVTNAHVLGMKRPPQLPPQKVSLVLNSGIPGKETTCEATLAGFDPDADLAFLRAKLEKDQYPGSLSLVVGKNVTETTPIFIFGYPFGDALAGLQGNPAVTIGSGTVSSLRVDPSGLLDTIQVNGDLNPGNSGGPIVSKNGEVVAVSVATVRGTQIGFAIPCDKVRQDLNGKVQSVNLSDVRHTDKTYSFHLEITLVDPLAQIEAVVLHGWVADPARASRPNPAHRISIADTDASPRRKIELRRTTTGIWQGEVTDLPLPDGKAFWYQASVNRKGLPHSSESEPAWLNVPEPPPVNPQSPTQGAVAIPLGPEQAASDEVEFKPTVGRNPDGSQFAQITSKSKPVSFPDRLLQLVAAPDGSVVYGIFEDLAVVKVFDPPTLKEIDQIRVPANPVSLYCTANRLAVACDESRVLTILDTGNRKPVCSVQLKDQPELRPIRVVGSGVEPGEFYTLWGEKQGGKKISVYAVNENGSARLVARKEAMEWCVPVAKGKQLFAQDRSGPPILMFVDTGGTDNLTQNKLLGNSGFIQDFMRAFRSADERMVVLPASSHGGDLLNRFHSYVVSEDLSRLSFEFPGIAFAEIPAENLLISFGDFVAEGEKNPQAQCIFYINRLSGQVVRKVKIDIFTLHPAYYTHDTTAPFVIFVPKHELVLFGDPFDKHKAHRVRCGPIKNAALVTGLKFDNEPPSVAYVGEKYLFTPVFSIVGSGKVAFKLKQALEGMSLDPATGKLEWTPSDVYLGKYDVSLTAELDGEVVNALSWTIDIQPTRTGREPKRVRMVARQSQSDAPTTLEAQDQQDDQGRIFQKVVAQPRFVKTPPGLIQVVAAPDGNSLLGIFSGDASIKVLDPETLKELHAYATPRFPVSIWCDDKRIVVACDESRVLCVLDAHTFKPVKSIRLKDRPEFFPLRINEVSPNEGILSLWKARGAPSTDLSCFRIAEDGTASLEAFGSFEQCILINRQSQILTQRPPSLDMNGVPHTSPAATGKAEHLFDIKLLGQGFNERFARCFKTRDGRHVVLPTAKEDNGAKIDWTYLASDDLKHIVMEFPGAAVAEVPEENIFMTWGATTSRDVTHTPSSWAYYVNRSTGQVIRKIQIANAVRVPHALNSSAQQSTVFLHHRELLISFEPTNPEGGVMILRCGPVKDALVATGVTIDNSPPAITHAGKEFVFIPSVSVTGADKVTFKLDAPQDGMRIDSDKGTVTWTPTAAQIGKFDLKIRADVDGQDLHVLNWMLEVQP